VAGEPTRGHRHSRRRAAVAPPLGGNRDCGLIAGTQYLRPGVPVFPALGCRAHAPPPKRSAIALVGPPRPVFVSTSRPGAVCQPEAPEPSPVGPTRVSPLTRPAEAEWHAAFAMWGLECEPDVAHELIVTLFACDSLLPSFIAHYASGVAKWCPPVNCNGVEQWFVDVLNTGPGHRQPSHGLVGIGGCISRAMLSRVHGLFSSSCQNPVFWPYPRQNTVTSENMS